MLIGKAQVLLLTVIFCVGCETTQTEECLKKTNVAWWVSEEFKPSKTKIRGTPVSKIMADWKYALLIDEKYLEKKLSKDKFKDIRQSKLKFDLQSNIDNTPSDETFVVGVYEALSGERGRFIAIYRNSEFIKVLMDPGLAGYSSIYLENSKIRWYKCMECGNFDSILWSGADYIRE